MARSAQAGGVPPGRAVVRTWLGEARDRVVASDPGLNRLSSAGRAVTAVGSTLGVEYLLTMATGAPALVPMLLGAVVSMIASFGAFDPTRTGKAITLVCLPLFLLAGMGVAVIVDGERLRSLLVFVAVMFVAVFIRRFGPRFFIGGMGGFIGYFFALFLRLTPTQLPAVAVAVAVAIAWVMLLTLVLLPVRNDRVLRRMIRAYEARLIAVGVAAEDLLGTAPAGREHHRAEARLHSRLVRVNEAALITDGQLGAPGAVPDDDVAQTVRGALFDGELAVAALVDAVRELGAQHARPDARPVPPPPVADVVAALRRGRWDDLARHAHRLAAVLGTQRSPEPAAAAPRRRAEVGDARAAGVAVPQAAVDEGPAAGSPCETGSCERELRRLAVAALALVTARHVWNDPGPSAGSGGADDPTGHPATEDHATEDHATDGTRGRGGSDQGDADDEDDEPGFEPAVQLFAGNLPGSAMTVRGMHEPPDSDDDGADDIGRAREGRGDDGRQTTTREPGRGLRRIVPPIARLSLTSRQAVQVAVATGAAVAAGDGLSGQRYYWAVLAAFIAFTGTATVAETVAKAANRTLGTMIGLLAAIPLVALTGSSISSVLPVVLISLFAGFYLLRVSYALMIFFITLMIGELYALLGTFTPALMVLRLEETAVGGAIGCAVSLLVLPTRTRAAGTAARRGLLAALRDLLAACDNALRHPAERQDLTGQARSVDAALHQVLLIITPLTRTWMIVPNPTARRGLITYTALAYHARRAARATCDATTVLVHGQGADRDDRARLTGACAQLDEIAATLGAERPRLPRAAFSAVVDLLAPCAGSSRPLAPYARELAALALALETLADTSGFLLDEPRAAAVDRDPRGTPASEDMAVTGRVCGPDDEPLAATVTLIDHDGRQSARVVAAADGRFRLTPTRPGPHLLLATPHRPDVDAAADGDGTAPRAAPLAERVLAGPYTALPDLRLPPAPTRADPASRAPAQRGRACTPPAASTAPAASTEPAPSTS